MTLEVSCTNYNFGNMKSNNLTFYSPSQFNMGYRGMTNDNSNGQETLVATGWTYFDFEARKQRVDYTFPGTVMSWTFYWDDRVMLANYTGFTWKNGEFTCNSGVYPAPFPHLEAFNPPMVGVSIIEPFGPCYGWAIDMGNYHMIYYTQVSSGWKPALMVSNIYSVKYTNPEENGIDSTTFAIPSECYNVLKQSRGIKISNEFELHQLIARDSWIASNLIFNQFHLHS